MIITKMQETIQEYLTKIINDGTKKVSRGHIYHRYSLHRLYSKEEREIIVGKFLTEGDPKYLALNIECGASESDHIVS